MKTEMLAKLRAILYVVGLYLLLIALGTIIIIQLEDHLDYLNGFYLMANVATGLGLGNISPETNGGKMFVSFYQLPLIGLFFFGLSVIF